MRIKWIEICGAIEQTDEGTNLFRVGVETTPVSELPATIRLEGAVAIVVNYYEAKAGGMMPLFLRVTDPHLQLVREVKWDWPVAMDAPELFHEGWEGSCVQDVPIMFEAQEAGTYTLEMRLADSEPVSVDHVILDLSAG